MNYMFFRVILFSYFILIFYSPVLAQQGSCGIVGSKIPELKINQQLFDNRKPSFVSELYKKGGLIINFWATWCAPCLKEQKLLDSLLQIYPDLSVLSITYEDSSIVKLHFAKNRLPKSKTMQIISNDIVFHDFFKHRIIPHNIWIDKIGVIKVITGADEINEKNIKAFLDGNTKRIYSKNDDLQFKFTKTYHVPDSLIQFRSYITGYNERITSGLAYGGDENGTFKHIFAWNRPIVQFFWLAYNNQESYKINWNLIELHTSDSTRFYQPRVNRDLFERSRYYEEEDFFTRERKWNKDNLYCYELTLPHNVSVSLSSKYMFNDLELFFNIKATIEKRKIMTSMVSLSHARFKMLSKIKHDKVYLKISHGVLSVKAASIKDILNFLSESFDNSPPYIDKTNYNGKLNFTIKGKSDQLTLSEIWEELYKIGLQRIEKRHFYPVLVLKDLNQS